MTQEEQVKQWMKECLTACLNEYTQHWTRILETKSKELEKKTQPNQWIFTNDVERILNVSPRTVKRLRKAKAIPYTKIGKTCYYPSIYFDKILLEQIKTQFNELFDE